MKKKLISRADQSPGSSEITYPMSLRGPSLRTQLAHCGVLPTNAFINSANAKLPGKCQSGGWLGKSGVPQDSSLSSKCEGDGELVIKELCIYWALSRSPNLRTRKSACSIRKRCVLWCVTSDVLHRQRDVYIYPLHQCTTCPDGQLCPHH